MCKYIILIVLSLFFHNILFSNENSNYNNTTKSKYSFSTSQLVNNNTKIQLSKNSKFGLAFGITGSVLTALFFDINIYSFIITFFTLGHFFFVVYLPILIATSILLLPTLSWIFIGFNILKKSYKNDKITLNFNECNYNEILNFSLKIKIAKTSDN